MITTSLLLKSPPGPIFVRISVGKTKTKQKNILITYKIKPMMRNHFVLLAVAVWITNAQTWGKFCSVVCGTSCSADLKTNCDSCQSDGAWVKSGNTCVVKTSAGWNYLDGTSDLGGTLTVTGATLTAFCYSFNLFGYANPATQIVVSTPGITVPYYAMRMYVGILAHNSVCSKCGSVKFVWQETTKIRVLFSDPLGTIAPSSNPIIFTTGTSKATVSGKCDNSQIIKSQWYRVSSLYTYNAMNTPMTWTFSVDETNATAEWGIRQFMILYQSCHWACTSCFGPAVTQCNSCVNNATHTLWLNNNTCNQSCLSQFGYSTPYTCVYCDKTCAVCNMVNDNCSSCTSSGANAAFLSTTANPSYPTCVKTCPNQTFANKTSRTCDPCNITCLTCVNSPNYCTSCQSGYFWTGWTCYSACPTRYFIDPNGVNCTKCLPYCETCNGSFNICTVCTVSGQYKAFLYNVSATNTTCTRLCPSGFYGQTYNGTGPNLCLACDTNCSLCTSYPTPCTECKPTFYLFNSTCIDTCPNGTVGVNTSGIAQCFDCDLVCVDLTISMYFPSVINDEVYIDMQFTQELNYSAFDITAFQNITITSQNLQYTLDMFTVTYKNLSTSSYRIILAPKTYIFLYNATFTVTTKAEPTPKDESLLKIPFKSSTYQKTASLTWFLIKGPPFSSLQIGIMNSLSTLSTKTNNLLTQPYVQQIKKSGVFSLLFSGAQVTSLSMLSNQIQSQNLYEGVRIWAIFVFFDAPPYEKISDKTKRFVAPTVQDKIRNSQEVSSEGRTLFSTDSMYWRFQRTGQTSFFIYDVYIPILLVVLCWIGMIIAHFSQKTRWYTSYASNIYSAVHKIHEISLMYVTMAAIVQFIYFSPTSFQRIISAAVCVFFNIYFLIYQLYIYYDMIKYPLAEIGNRYYDYYVLRYGFFLKNIRFVQYDINQIWSPRHLLRPYNYHILSFYKKFMMIIALPLFYSTQYAQMAILSFIQLVQIIRMWNTWPYVSAKRNYIRLSLELSLFLFFIINIVQINLLETIMIGDASVLQKTTAVFYSLGWTGFACCCYFNLAFVCIGVYDMCVCLRVTNRTKMDEARKKYYFHKIRDYEKENQSSSKELVNRWVKLGNLNDKSYGDLPEINIRVELYQFKKAGPKFDLSIKKLTSLKMKPKLKLHKPNNTTAGSKIQKQMILSQYDNPRLYNILSDLYKKYEAPHVETIRLKTFLNVWQKDFQQGDSIPLDRNLMFQKIQLISYNNQSQEFRLQSLFPQFPLSEGLICNTLL